jgi:hypothetical protein
MLIKKGKNAYVTSRGFRWNSGETGVAFSKGVKRMTGKRQVRVMVRLVNGKFHPFQVDVALLRFESATPDGGDDDSSGCGEGSSPVTQAAAFNATATTATTATTAPRAAKRRPDDTKLLHALVDRVDRIEKKLGRVDTNVNQFGVELREIRAILESLTKLGTMRETNDEFDARMVASQLDMDKAMDELAASGGDDGDDADDDDA